MDAAKFERTTGISKTSTNAKVDFALLIPALLMVAAAVVGGLAWLILGENRETVYSKLYLLPWVSLCGVVVITPVLVLLFKRKLDFFHPLVLAAWSYFFPAFVVGGFLLAFGITEPTFMHLIENPEVDLPLTYIYIALGFGGLTLGYLIPWGGKFGAWLSARAIPRWDWQPSEVVFPSVVLMGIGLFFYFSAWVAGSVGYQQVVMTDSFSGFNFFLSLLTLQASLMIWLFIFKTKNLSFGHIVVLSLLLFVSLSRIALAGNKGSLLTIVILVAMAFVYSGRQLKIKHAAIFGCLGVVALLVGVVYGMAFRQLKGSEDKTDLVQYLGYAEKSVDSMLTQDPTRTIGDGMYAIGERIEQGSSLAVVVSNYEKLAPYEAAYGLDNNIWTYTWTAFIPRFVWEDKPVVSDARAYSDLYFNYGDSSFAITPMGDLLRNFGPVGVPLGMVLLGFILRIIYSALIENQTISIGRAAVYYMLVTSVSYEGFYGVLLPSLLRAAFIAVLSLILVGFLAGHRGGRQQKVWQR